MRQGISDVIKYYALAIGISIVSILLVGMPLGHGVGEITLAIPILFVIGAICWIIFAIVKLMTATSSQRIRGQLWTHILILMLVGIVLSTAPML